MRLLGGHILRGPGRAVWPLAVAVAVTLAAVLPGLHGQARAAGEATLLPNLVADPPDNVEIGRASCRERV